jgi:hypothetical protein
MTADGASKKDVRSSIGKALLTAGTLLAVGQLALLFWQCGAFLSRSADGAPGLWESVGFASLSLLRLAAFSPEAVFWFAVKLLILFVAFGTIVTSLAFLRNKAAGPPRDHPLRSVSRRGDQ